MNDTKSDIVSPTPTVGELSSQYVKLKLKLRELSKHQFRDRDRASYDDRDQYKSNGEEANPATPNSSSPSIHKRHDSDNNNTFLLSTHRRRQKSLTLPPSNHKNAIPQPQNPTSSLAPPAAGATTNNISLLHARLKRDIRTAKLRKTHQNALLHRVDHLIRTYKTQLTQKNSTIRQWTLHADAVTQNCHNQLRAESQKRRDVTAERDAARERAEDVATALQSLKRRAERVKEECRKTMATEREECAATLQNELDTRDEDSRRHCRVALKRSEERFRDAQRRYESEALREQNRTRNENEMLREELERIKEEFREVNRRADDLERRNETLQNQLGTTTATTSPVTVNREANEKIKRDCEARVSDSRIEMKRTLMKRADEIAAFDDRKRNELRDVETSVKRVVEDMAEKVAAAEGEASKTEARARRVEGFIEDSDDGFEEEVLVPALLL